MEEPLEDRSSNACAERVTGGMGAEPTSKQDGACYISGRICLPGDSDTNLEPAELVSFYRDGNSDNHLKPEFQKALENYNKGSMAGGSRTGDTREESPFYFS